MERDRSDIEHIHKLDHLKDMAHMKAKELGHPGHSEGYSHEDCPVCWKDYYPNLSQEQFGRA